MKDAKSRLHLIQEIFEQYNALHQPRDIIFIISHMRSRSTLLSHILGSNKNICGHSEQHIRYRGMLDIYDLKLRLMNEENYEQAKYLLDKILHNHRLLRARVIRKTRPKLILMTRQPVDSVKSIKKMLIRENRYNNLEDIINYYKARIDGILGISKRNSGKYIFIESNDLIKETTSTLLSLQKFLHLRTPLEAEYKVFDDTGEAGRGDQSENIKAGKILEIIANTDGGESSRIREYFDDDYYRNITEIIRNHSVNYE